MKIANVYFPELLLNALRDGRLVVFAGAGVSMAPPAGLPDFRRLANQVAEGTGESIGNAETEDRFLGRLRERRVKVHQRAADILQWNAPKPTALHLSLLRLFGERGAVRVVTTNFDDLFESTALSQYDSHPRVFQAPALPLGNRFHGIVHLHGSVNEPEEMVLTHRDFGRAYLTESDGWARRFLVNLFTNYTVLFVGYSHSDTIMTYLTPSLPQDGSQKRFALVGDQSGNLDHWSRMGIEPVTFQQAHASDFRGLDAAVAGLADFVRRGILGWQREITAVAGGHPPIDDETAGIIEHALRDVVTIRFFVESAESPEWIDWLDRRGYLAPLFKEGVLESRETMLAMWLADRFAINHSDKLFAIIARHGGRLNSHLWNRLAWSLRDNDEATLSASVLSRWVHFLMTCVPPDYDYNALPGLAEACANLGEFQNLLQLYDVMTATRRHIGAGFGRDTNDIQFFLMQKLWKECLQPHLAQIAHSLLDRTAMRLEYLYSVAVVWERSDGTLDADSFGRSAIEPHEQDRFPHAVDILIDVARDCLEWLATNDSVFAGAWCNRYIGSDAPLLRRLSIHATSAREDLSADCKIAWLLEHCDINETSAHHEIFRLAAHSYPQAHSEQRIALVQAVSEYQAPESEHHDSDQISAYRRFTWFHWLHEADPDCNIARESLEAVCAQHPDFEPSDHPDFTHWVQVGGVTSPWTSNVLLAKSANEVLPDLLTYEPTDQERLDEYDSRALLRAVEEAAQADSSWGLDLADAMAETGEWNSDLWQRVLSAWKKADLDRNDVKRVLSHLSTDQLHPRHPREIADVLSELVRKSEEVEVIELLASANSIAMALRPYAAAGAPPQITSSVGGVPQYVTWLTNALNHASGQLALFWTFSIELWRKRRESIPQSLSAEYRKALDAIVEDDGVPGKFGRAVLAGNFHFFLAADEDWTIKNLLPLFDTEHEDFQCAWDGFLSWGSLSLQIAELLREKFINGVPRVAQEFQGEMLTRFVKYYVATLGWLINGANDDWITEFFKYANEEMRDQFALEVGHNLRDLDETAQQEWWNVWLKDYWKNRLQRVPDRLDDLEIAQMLEWVIHLTGVFSEAVNLATQMRHVSLSRSYILHNLGESELIERYPNDLAKFLICVAQHDTDQWFWHGTREIFDKLLVKDLQPDISRGLRELIVTYSIY